MFADNVNRLPSSEKLLYSLYGQLGYTLHHEYASCPVKLLPQLDAISSFLKSAVNLVIVDPSSPYPAYHCIVLLRVDNDRRSRANTQATAISSFAVVPD